MILLDASTGRVLPFLIILILKQDKTVYTLIILKGGKTWDILPLYIFTKTYIISVIFNQKKLHG